MQSVLRLAFAGFQHRHILSLHALAATRDDMKIVGACESDPERAEEIQRREDVTLTHSNLEQMLREVDCDVVAIGDVYGKRGAVAIACLSAGKHIISDKPVCTDLAELEQIARLATEKHLSIGCQFDLRSSGAFRGMRRLIATGVTGPIHTVTVTAQHPLLLGSRPGWYFQPGQQGGTLNDIGVHAMDLIPWVTGRRPVEAIVARAWNARLPQYPFFSDAAQFMLRLDNDGGMLGDVSYLAPDGCGYATPQYWRLTCHGERAVIEAQGESSTVSVACGGDRQVDTVAGDPVRPAAYLQDFMDELAGNSQEGALTTQSIIETSRRALLLQKAADDKRHHAPLE